MLGSNDHVMDPSGNHSASVFNILHGNLCLGVRSKPWEDALGVGSFQVTGDPVR
jgi:hypothetical protein